jgi:hypothetical protein
LPHFFRQHPLTRRACRGVFVSGPLLFLAPIHGHRLIAAGPGHSAASRFSATIGLYFSSVQGRGLPMQTNVETLQQRINELNIEHRDLDDIIARLSQNPEQDELQLRRLKKKKLMLKDQILQLEKQLTPDIRA